MICVMNMYPPIVPVVSSLEHEGWPLSFFFLAPSLLVTLSGLQESHQWTPSSVAESFPSLGPEEDIDDVTWKCI